MHRELTQLQVEIGLLCPTNSPDRAVRLSIIETFHVEDLNLQRHVAVLIGKYLQTFRRAYSFSIQCVSSPVLVWVESVTAIAVAYFINRLCVYREDFIHTALTLDLSLCRLFNVVF